MSEEKDEIVVPEESNPVVDSIAPEVTENDTFAASNVMNDLFVSEEDSFPLTVYYTKEDGFRAYAEDELNAEDKKSGKYKSIEITFLMPDWETGRNIMQGSIIHYEGQAMLSNTEFQNNLFQALVSDWDLCDSDGNKVEFSYSQLVRMRPDIVRCFIAMLQRKLMEEGVLAAILEG